MTADYPMPTRFRMGAPKTRPRKARPREPQGHRRPLFSFFRYNCQTAKDHAIDDPEEPKQRIPDNR